MILIDANLLIYATMKTFSNHSKVKEWLDKKLNGETPVGMPWSSILSFLRIVTNPRIFEAPVSSKEAWKVIEFWLDCPTVWIPQSTEKHRRILERLIQETSVQANLIPDAHLAALAIEHGLMLCSTDGDFARFRKLKWENPFSI